MTQNDEQPIDLVWGIAAIAKMIGRNERQTYDMLASGHLPAKQVGTRWVAERGKLTSFFTETAA
ncbi:DNA-binding protein [Aurantimonas sp. DM33-3]|uniref:DNA-binding protein n=1 Tax=Aurantimonas sp. DM33-3 TaxID=2766955 RepID=UPI00165239AA|nr:DNA-binding protein [Aurantimonas sp. DM33-3]MBC6714713.1 DNA-binding protein [Aurantimonas sp. DM33-3]